MPRQAVCGAAYTGARIGVRKAVGHAETKAICLHEGEGGVDLMALVSRHILFPTADRVHGVSVAPLLRSLMRSQYFPEEKIRENQWYALQRTLRYAFTHTRFYRTRFDDAGITPDDIRSFSDFSQLPVLTKNDVRDHLDDLTSDEFDRKDLFVKHTGGSTGVPLQMYVDKEASLVRDAVRQRHYRWAGFLRGEKRAALWASITPVTTFRRRLSRALFSRTIFLNTLEIDERSTLKFVDQIRQTGTRLLFGHGHSLYFFARFLQDKGIRDVKLDGILSMAETLPPEERSVVEDVFGNIVFDWYACEEVGLMASECEERDGLHIAAEAVYLEILDEEAGEPGRVVVTDLVNRGTPLIRYELRDLSTVKSGICSCGRGLPRIGPVVGRTTDILRSPEGRRISGVSFQNRVLIYVPGLRQIQVVQEKLDHLTFNIVRDHDFSDQSLKLLSEAVVKYFGTSMKHKVVFVDKIPLTERGKFQISISKLEPNL